MNKSISKLGILVLLLVIPGSLFAQQGKVRGAVMDSQTGDPLPGANVVIEGTTLGASADLDGGYIILGVPPGVYTIRANFIGYQSTSIANIRVNSNLTTTQDFGMNQTAIQVEALEIVADRPIVQRNTTNTVRMQTQEDIENLPIRGLQNIVALNAGTVQQDGVLYIRGGRNDEVGYFVDGATASNPLFQAENVTVIQEAIEEIQMQAGGFTAEYGGSNSGIVNTTVRTGGSQLRATLDYRTDDLAKGGDEFLGTTSRGYHNIVATLGGPLSMVSNKLRFFVAGQYNSLRNRNPLFIEPFSFDPLDSETSWLVEDGLSGRSEFAGTPLTTAEGDTIPFAFERNFLPNNEYRDFQLNGTLVYDLSASVKLRLTGTYQRQNEPNNGFSNFYDAVNNFFSNTVDEETWNRGLINLRATHLINPTTFYDVSVNWSTRNYESIDPRFGSDWIKYSDALAWGDAGMDTTQWQGRYVGPPSYSTILDFTLTPPNLPNNGYAKDSQTSIGGTLNFTSQLTRNVELKVGGRIDTYTMRSFNVGNISNYMNFFYGSDGSLWPDGRVFEQGPADDPDYQKRILLTRQGGLGYYGYDYDGSKVDSGPYGPNKPFFGSAYLQTKLEYRDLILNIGARYERMDYNAKRPEVVENPEYDKQEEWIDVNSLVDTEPYEFILPRVNFAFPVTDNTVFYAQYGKYAQTVQLNSIYQSYASLSNIIPERRSVYGAQVLFLAKPERNDQYELGIRQALTEDFAFTVTAFYKDMYDLLRRDRIYSDGTVPAEEGGLEPGSRFIGGLINNDIATSKGLEMTLDLRRTKRLAARINYTISNTRGTGSTRGSNNVIMSDVTVARYPTLIYNLDQNQSHRGSLMLDYRFARNDGGFLQGSGLNLLLTFNSGHSYTSVNEPFNLGQANPWNVGTRMTADNRFRNPTEPVNSSSTPWVFNVDMNLEKMFYFERFNFKLYTTILNLFNTKNIINVYQTTGTDNDDGWLKSPLASQYVQIPGYRQFYDAINLQNGWGWYNATATQLWAAPRQVRFGVTIEFQ